MLYRSMDNIIETQTGGGDILNASPDPTVNEAGKLDVVDQAAAFRRNSELNSYAEIAISD